MPSLLLLLVPLLAPAQEDPVRWIERLGSESLEERARTTRALQDLGPAALPALREARSNPDAEIASRASSLVALIETGQEFPPRLRKAVPDLIRRLAAKETGWDAALLELSDRERHPRIRRGDLEALLPCALAAPADPETRKSLILTLASRGLVAAAPHLILYLADPDARTRQEAIRWLAALDPLSGPHIAKLLRDPHPQVMETALHSLVGLRPASAVPQIAELLRDERIWIRLAAVQAMSGLGGPAAARHLVPMLRDPHRDVRERAMQALIQNPDRSAAPLLLDLLGDPVPETRAAAVRILAAAGVGEAGPEILRMLEDGAPAVRSEVPEALVALRSPALEMEIVALLEVPERQVDALRLLGRLRAFTARPRVARLLAAKSPEVRRAAVETAAALRDWEGLPDLLARTEDRDPGVRVAALSALAGLGAEAALPKLVQSLKDPEARAAAVRGLARMGARAEASRVAEFFDDSDGSVRDAARDALAELELPAYRERILPDLVRRLANPEDRASSLHALTGIGARSLSTRIVPFLEDDQDEVRSAAAAALAELGGPEQVPALVILLKSERAEVREEAVKGLMQLGTPETARDLRPLLRDPAADVRAETARALAALEGAGAIPSLERLLDDRDTHVRWTAIHALVEVKARDRAGKMVPLLQDPTLEIRHAAAYALNALDAREHAAELVRPLRTPESNGHGLCPFAQAQDALRRWKPREVAPRILDLLREPRSHVRLTALATLEMIEVPVPEAMPRTLLEDPEPSIRSQACHELAEAGAKEAIASLRPLLEDEEDSVRVAAAAALHRMGEGSARAVLEKLGVHPDPRIRIHAAVSLGTTSALLRLLEDPDRWARDGGLRALAERGARETIPKIAALLAGPSRKEAAEALGRLGSGAHAPEIAGLLGDPDASVLHAAAAALLALDPAPAAAALSAELDRDPRLLLRLAGQTVLRLAPRETLARCARDPDPDLRARAIELLGRFADPAALGDSDPAVRRQAVEALGSAGDEALLAPLLRDPQSEVRVAAAKVLCLRGRKEAGRVLLEEAGRWPRVDLTALNALRQPTAWSALAKAEGGGARLGPRVELLRSLVEKAGISCEIPRRGFGPGEGWYSADASIANALEQLLAPTPYAFIVEPGRLRLIPREEVSAFWKAWADRP